MVATLTGLGWNHHWEAAFAPFATTHIAGRIRLVHRGKFDVFTEFGEFDAEPNPKLRPGKDRAVTGDWVALTPDGTRIDAILPRRTAFVRRDPGDRMRPQAIAANADVAFLVMGLDLDYNVRRLERYLYLTAESGARPVIVLNKSDLCDDLATCVRECEKLAPLVVLNARAGEGIGLLSAQMQPHETAVLLGSSGAGKSTIANRLRGNELIPTAPVREHDSRGRHTTTRRELIQLEQGWLLMDVPGMRGLQVWTPHNPQALDIAFHDVAAILAEGCRFSDCRHDEEPGCLIRAALESGQLDEGRWDNYCKLRGELTRLGEATELQAKEKEKQRWKSLRKKAGLRT
ncbi:MAG: ribosome small subunit-dependent GTPase A [Bryobacteraceae bacterium]|nr:ribosome small subunit-dependent GTPase A [Bryobacteraceae bacterium]